MEISEGEVILITDGGYDGQNNITLTKEKNAKLVTTALIGKETPVTLADFEFNEDGTHLLKCAAGHEPASQRFIKRSPLLLPQKMRLTEPKANNTFL